MHAISRFLLLASLTFVCFFVSTHGNAADIPFDSIIEDLGVINAAVIVGPDGRLLLNKGSLHAVRRGDLWSIHTKGAMVKDPVSGEELGRLDEILGVVKVVRTDKRFCQIERVHPADVTFKTGLQAIRYSRIKSIFQDSSGVYYGLYEKLRAGLPNLNWQGYQKVGAQEPVVAPADGIVFSARNDRLIIWSGGEILSVYENSSSNVSPIESDTSLSLNEKEPHRSDQNEASLPEQPLPSRNPVIQAASGLMTPGMSAKIASRKYRSVGSLDDIVYHLDVMVDKSGKDYFVYLSDAGLFVQTALGAEKAYEYRYEGFGRVAGISIGPNGMIAMNIFNQSEWAMASMLLRFSGEGFEILARDINYILAYVDINDDGNKELIGQNFDNENFFGPGVYELAWDNTQISRISTLDLPVGFRIFGSFWADLDNDHVVENGFYNSGRRLLIYARGEEAWRSTDPFGGSIQGVMIENIESEGATSRSEIVWSPAAVVPYKNGKFVALAYNDASLLNIVGMRPRKGKVGILYKNNGRYFLRILDAGFEGPVQSVFVWQNELYCAVVEGGLFSGRGGKTHVIAFSLKDLKKALE